MHDIFIISLASVIAGIGTGLLGLSAATAITPLLIGCGVPVHQAIYVALLSDVVASAVTSKQYWANHWIKNNGKTEFPVTVLVIVFTIIFTVVGALVSFKVSDGGVGGFASAVSLFVGVKFIVEYIISKVKKTSTKDSKKIAKIFQELKKWFQERATKEVMFIGTLIGGALIGLTSGFAGVGGGLTMLLVFRLFGYKFKDAVCVSTFTMVFVALIGGVFHMVHYGLGDEIVGNNMNGWVLLFICMLITTLVAWGTSKLANNSSDKNHKLFCGILLLISVGI